MNNEIIILDIETTGLSVNNSEITEVAAIKANLDTLEIIDEMSSLVKINGNVNAFIENLTGINDRMLAKHGNDLGIVLSQLSKFCGSRVAYAHNASFDKRFIRHFLGSSNVNYVETEWVDTLSIFRSKWPNLKNHKLDTLIRKFNIADKESHRALDDAKHTLVLLKKARDLDLA